MKVNIVRETARYSLITPAGLALKAAPEVRTEHGLGGHALGMSSKYVAVKKAVVLDSVQNGLTHKSCIPQRAATCAHPTPTSSSTTINRGHSFKAARKTTAHRASSNATTVKSTYPDTPALAPRKNKELSPGDWFFDDD